MKSLALNAALVLLAWACTACDGICSTVCQYYQGQYSTVASFSQPVSSFAVGNGYVDALGTDGHSVYQYNFSQYSTVASFPQPVSSFVVGNGYVDALGTDGHSVYQYNFSQYSTVASFPQPVSSFVVGNGYVDALGTDGHSVYQYNFSQYSTVASFPQPVSSFVVGNGYVDVLGTDGHSVYQYNFSQYSTVASFPQPVSSFVVGNGYVDALGTDGHSVYQYNFSQYSTVASFPQPVSSFVVGTNYIDALVAIPEPSTFVLLAAGAISLLVHVWRRRSARGKGMQCPSRLVLAPVPKRRPDPSRRHRPTTHWPIFQLEPANWYYVDYSPAARLRRIREPGSPVPWQFDRRSRQRRKCVYPVCPNVYQCKHTPQRNKSTYDATSFRKFRPALGLRVHR